LEFGLKLELTAGAVLSVKEKLELGLNGGVAAGAGWLSVKAKLELGLNGGFAAGAGWLSVKAKLELGLKDVFGGLSVKAKPELPEGLKLVAAAGDGVGSKSISRSTVGVGALARVSRGASRRARSSRGAGAAGAACWLVGGPEPCHRFSM